MSSCTMTAEVVQRMADADPMLTVDEVAKRIRTSDATVRRWLREKKLRGVRPGGTRLGWRIPASEVERLLRGEEAPKIAEAA